MLLQYILESAPEGSLKDLTDFVNLEDMKPETKGGFSEVYSINIEGKIIAVKNLSLGESQDFVIRNFARELRVLARLSHPNVSTFLGYVLGEDKNYYILSEWMAKGSLQQHLESLDKSTSNMPASQLFATSLGIAKGVRYLHGNSIVHADIKAANVLVSRSGEPLLADFGLSRMTESFWSKGFYTTEASRHSTRWLPHEYYYIGETEKFRPNPKSDVWAFGMTLLELLTCKVPYAHIRNDGALQRAIVNGVLPEEPKYEDPISDDAKLKHDVWSLCCKCWDLDPEKRLSMQDVLRELIRTKYRNGVGL